MAKYEEISRRGLIRLGHDYDRENDNALDTFLNREGGAEYEAVRPIEQIIDRADSMAATLTKKGGDIAIDIMQSMENKMTEFVDGLAEDIASGQDFSEEDPT